VHLGIKATKSEDEEQKQQGKKAEPKSWKYERSEYFWNCLRKEMNT
jgi:hypothetical protein